MTFLTMFKEVKSKLIILAGLSKVCKGRFEENKIGLQNTIKQVKNSVGRFNSRNGMSQLRIKIPEDK